MKYIAQAIVRQSAEDEIGKTYEREFETLKEMADWLGYMLQKHDQAWGITFVRGFLKV